MRLPPGTVRRIRRLYQASRLTQVTIARRFGISQAHVSRLVKGVTRRDPGEARLARASRARAGRATEVVCVDGTTGEETRLDLDAFKKALWPYSIDPQTAVDALLDGATVKTPFAFYEGRPLGRRPRIPSSS